MDNVPKFNVLGRASEMFGNPRSCDIDFLFEHDDPLKAHKAILASNSDVFDAMFYGPLANLPVDNVVHVQIVDVCRASFENFLQYFYFGAAQLNESNVADLMYLGQKYNVAQCVTDGVDFLLDTLNDGNVASRLNLGILYGNREIQSRCERLIVSDTNAFFASIDNFKSISKMSLEHISHMEVLSCKEAELLRACLSWVQAETGEIQLTKEIVEASVGNLLWKCIRYGSISTTELYALKTDYRDVFLQCDFKDILTNLLRQTDNSPKFNMKKREPTWSTNAVIDFNRNTLNWLSGYKRFEECEVVHFVVLRPLLLGTITLSEVYTGHENDRQEYSLFVPLLILEAASESDDAEPKKLVNTLVRIYSSATEISLTSPILLRPGHIYTIQLEDLPRSYMYIGRHLQNCNGSIIFYYGESSIVTAMKLNII